MSCSPARLNANRLNALKSTGPKSPEGKAASRLNAFKHGMAGQGDLPGPGDDLALVARRSAALARELKATGEVGSLMARRAALLSVRMESQADRDLRAKAANAEKGRDEFDAERLGEIDRLIAELDGEGATAALVALQEVPDGVSHLIAAWLDLRERLVSDDPASNLNRATAWLGLSGDEANSLSNREAIERVDVEVARLERLLDSMTDQAKAIDQARTNAGILAGFDPSPEATLAQRYEAAAERGMYRAFKAIAQLNRAAGREQALSDPTGSHSQFSSIAKKLLPLLNAANPRLALPLASFRAAGSPPTPPTPRAIGATADPTPKSPEERKKRPDLKEAAREHALARR